MVFTSDVVANRAQPESSLPKTESPTLLPTAKIMSSTSPSKEPEVEQEPQSGEEQDQMDKDQDHQGGGPGEFEVKEQDRWLPIANG